VGLVSSLIAAQSSRLKVFVHTENNFIGIPSGKDVKDKRSNPGIPNSICNSSSSLEKSCSTTGDG
jgi:hypothetical protein